MKNIFNPRKKSTWHFTCSTVQCIVDLKVLNMNLTSLRHLKTCCIYVFDIHIGVSFRLHIKVHMCFMFVYLYLRFYMNLFPFSFFFCLSSCFLKYNFSLTYIQSITITTVSCCVFEKIISLEAVRDGRTLCKIFSFK